MHSVQMGRASDTCSIKGIRGDPTTLLSASWPTLISLSATTHSQCDSLICGPATCTSTFCSFSLSWQIHILNLFTGLCTGVSMFICLSPVCKKKTKQKSTKRRGGGGVVGANWTGFHSFQSVSSHKNKRLSFYQFSGEIKLLG